MCYNKWKGNSDNSIEHMEGGETRAWKEERITFFEIKRTFSLLCCFSFFLLVISQYLCLNILCWTRSQLFILKGHINVIKSTDKRHTSEGRQTSKRHVLTTHDKRSSISFMRSGSLYFFKSFLRACYAQKMSRLERKVIE